MDDPLSGIIEIDDIDIRDVMFSSFKESINSGYLCVILIVAIVMHDKIQGLLV